MFICNFTGDPPELNQGAPEPTKEGRGEDTFHLKNFFECMRSRKLPNAHVEIAHGGT
jgi:hypothetical protein